MRALLAGVAALALTAIPATAQDIETTVAQYASKGQGTTLPLALAIPLGCAVSVNSLYGLKLKP